MNVSRDYLSHADEARRQLRVARRMRQVEFLKATFRTGSHQSAADALGVSIQHYKNTLGDLYTRLNVMSATEAAYVLWLRDLWAEGPALKEI